MSYTFQYAEVLELKKACAEHFPDHVHFHDGCGGQYFSLDEENDALLRVHRRVLCGARLNGGIHGRRNGFHRLEELTKRLPHAAGAFSMEILPKVL